MRPSSTRGDRLLILGLLAAALVLFAVFGLLLPGGDRWEAVVSLDGEDILVLDLSGEDQVLSLEPWGVAMEVEVRDHAVRVRSSDCPDQICVRQGWLRQSPQSAVCLPNRVSVVVQPRS